MRYNGLYIQAYNILVGDLIPEAKPTATNANRILILSSSVLRALLQLTTSDRPLLSSTAKLTDLLAIQLPLLDKTV